MSKRKTYYDFMRICAAFCVIYSHLPGCVKYQSSENILTIGVYIFVGMFIRIHVPVFFMISGALLLGKEEKIGDILKNRVVRMCVVLVLFGGILYFVKGLSSVEFGMADYIRKLFEGAIGGEYWFLYAYIAFLLMLPYMRRMTKGLSHTDFIYILIIHFCINTIVPIINYGFSVVGVEEVALAYHLKLPLMTERMLFYPIMGYYLDKVLNIEKVNRGHLKWLVCAACAGIISEALITIHQGVTYGYTQNYVAILDYVIAISFFVIVKYMFEHKGVMSKYEVIQNKICMIGELTFGMYLLDPIWRNLFAGVTVNYLERYLPTLLVSVFWCVMSMFLSGIVTIALKKFPVFRRVL